LEVKQAVDRLKSLGDPKAVEGMARFGIQSSSSFGVSVPLLRTLAREIGLRPSVGIEIVGDRTARRETPSYDG